VLFVPTLYVVTQKVAERLKAAPQAAQPAPAPEVEG